VPRELQQTLVGQVKAIQDRRMCLDKHIQMRLKLAILRELGNTFSYPLISGLASTWQLMTWNVAGILQHFIITRSMLQ